MDKIKKVTIGISTYGSLQRADGCIRSFWSNLDRKDDLEIKTVVVDDGTPDVQALKDRRDFCRRFNFALIEHGNNRGISTAWNTLASFDPDADLVFIANDDIRFIMPGWLTRLVHFFDNNEQVGTVGLPLIHEPGFKDDDPRWWAKPDRISCAGRYAFSVRPKDLFSIENPDGSKGFFVSLVSFHEELFCGFKLAEKGYDSWMLPFPMLYHQGGATFAANEEPIWRTPSPDLPMEVFLKYVRQSKWYVKEYESKYAEGIVDRMSFSRIQLCLHYGLLDEIEANGPIREIKGEMVNILDEPQKPIHAKFVDTLPSKTIKWLDKGGQEKEEII